MWAHRPFTALVWSGAFERHPRLKLVLTETGCSWIVESLRVLESNLDLDLFTYFTEDLSLRPIEYFRRQCCLGASFLTPAEGEDRHRIGLDRLMWGTDYPHLEGTWPNTMDSLRKTFATYPEDEIRPMLGETAPAVYGFDRAVLDAVSEKISAELAEIRAAG
jgi:predicted TIM-barrel fold metal-dependent hydrolase